MTLWKGHCFVEALGAWELWLSCRCTWPAAPYFSANTGHWRESRSPKATEFRQILGKSVHSGGTDSSIIWPSKSKDCGDIAVPDMFMLRSAVCQMLARGFIGHATFCHERCHLGNMVSYWIRNFGHPLGRVTWQETVKLFPMMLFLHGTATVPSTRVAPNSNGRLGLAGCGGTVFWIGSSALLCIDEVRLFDSIYRDE